MSTPAVNLLARETFRKMSLLGIFRSYLEFTHID